MLTKNLATPTSPEATAALQNAAVSRYDILDRSGEGTLFVVYHVREKTGHSFRALKALKGAYSRHVRFSPAFIAAAQKIAALRHPHLASLFEIGREEDTIFLIEDWLPGGSLESRLRRAPMGQIETVLLATQILDCLTALHENGILHGDLRPRQILYDAEGAVRLTDVGFYTAYEAAGMNISDIQLEAIHYHSPERCDSGSISPASDLYALGVLLYRVLTGRVPFDGPSPLSIAMRHRNDTPLRPSQFNPQCLPELEKFVLRLLEKEPAARFASAREALRAIAPEHRLTPASRAFNTFEADQADATKNRPTLRPPNGTTVNRPVEDSVDASAEAALAAAANAPRARRNAGVMRAAPVDAALESSRTAVTSGATTAGATASAAGATASAAAVAAANTVSPPSEAASTPERVLPTPSAAPVRSVTQVKPQAPLTSDNTPTPGDAAIDTHLDTRSVAEIKRQTRLERKRLGIREMVSALLALFWTVLAAGALLGVCYGAYYFWIKEAPPEVRVPKYVGLNQADAQTVLLKKGLKMRIGKEVYNPKKPEGTVIGGDPPPGKLVRVGRFILVTVSRGEEPIRMVDFSELSLEQARGIINRHGMRLGQVAEQYHVRIPKGFVCGQYPEPGESFRRSEPINLIISRGPQPSSVAPDPSALPVAPPAPRLPDRDPVSSPNPDAGTTLSGENLIVRGAVVSVALPTTGGPQEVKIVVRDAEGEYTAYQQTHEAGDVIDKTVQVVREQNATALVRIYVGGRLLREIRV